MVQKDVFWLKSDSGSGRKGGSLSGCNDIHISVHIMKHALKNITTFFSLSARAKTTSSIPIKAHIRHPRECKRIISQHVHGCAKILIGTCSFPCSLSFYLVISYNLYQPCQNRKPTVMPGFNADKQAVTCVRVASQVSRMTQEEPHRQNKKTETHSLHGLIDRVSSPARVELIPVFSSCCEIENERR